MRILALLALVVGCASCKHISLERHLYEVERPQSITAGGVQWNDLFLGEGPAAQGGDVVVFDYTIWLEDGTRVDSTLDRGVPLESALGTLPVEGLNQGLIGMRPGGRRRMTIPPQLAYGSKGVADLVPPNSVLECEVHMVEVRPQKP
ncbi:MAG: FKBP-type peptidyl-prolyl cis-trans isomerase [Planctomycetes bacterium]|nr:FKBP-type peptidyl-prolyl cis-trans isomerase [Planctomycetota bacterium]